MSDERDWQLEAAQYEQWWHVAQDQADMYRATLARLAARLGCEPGEVEERVDEWRLLLERAYLWVGCHPQTSDDIRRVTELEVEIQAALATPAPADNDAMARRVTVSEEVEELAP